MVIEISFPRGGRKPPVHKTAQVNHVQYDLFGKKKPKHKKIDLRNEMGLKNPMEKNICPEEILKTTADLLSYKSIQEGMVIMGSVREVQKMTLSVLLPGRISGRVMITQISAPYTKLLHSIAANSNANEFLPIKDLFCPGQHVPTKVVKINNDDEKCQISLSLTPQDVNSELSYKNVSSGMLLWGAISDCEEHGYVIDLGIKNCRAFLPKSNVDEEKSYHVGQVLWCNIQKYVIDGVASTATVNVRADKIKSIKIIKDVSLNYLQPGMHVDLTISKILGNGLEGMFLNDFVGYVHESYLRGIFDKIETFKVEQIVSARILYIEPVTKLTYLTLKEFNPVEKPEFLEGTLTIGTILNLTRGGLYIKMNKNLKGFVSFKRLKTRLPISGDLNYTDLVRKHYKIGSQHQCRILSYDFMEQVYICTMEKDLIKEIIFSYNDLKLGQVVMIEILAIQKNGLFVQLGRVTGFILNEHLTDTVLPSYDKFKDKYSVGQKLKAKIWNIKHDNSSLLLTIKPSLLSSQNNITSYEDAEHNKQYPGIIVQITSNGVLVIFFGNVKGWIPRKQLSFERVDYPEKMFKIGQIINCTVIKSSPASQKLSLSLQPPKAESTKQKLRLGQIVDARITAILSNALQVEVAGSNVGAIVPTQYLTDSTRLADLILNTYNVNDVLQNLVCINLGHGVPILSVRDSGINENNLKSLEDIQEDMLLSCSVHSTSNKNMLLYCPIKNFEKLIVVPRHNICEMTSKINNLDIKKYQRIYAQVTKIQKNAQSICASTELSKCWNGDLNSSKELLSTYLSDINKIKDSWLAKEQKLSKYKMGQNVTGTVKKTHKGKIIVKIDDDINGKIHFLHATEGLKVGDEINGVVLWLNYKQNLLELTVLPKYKSRINSFQNGHIKTQVGKNLIGDIMLVKREFILVALRGNGNRQLAFLPAQLHPNDLLPNTHLYKIGEEIKVQILQLENKQIIGISRELAKNFENARKAMKRTAVLSESSQEGNVKKRKKNNPDIVELKENKNKKRKKDHENNAKAKKPKLTEENDLNSDNGTLEEKIEDNEDENNTEPEEESEDNSLNEEIDQNFNSNETEENDLDEDAEEESDGDSSLEEQNDEPVVQITKVTKEAKKKVKTKKNKTQTKTNEELDSEDEIETTKPVKFEPVLSGVSSFWEAPVSEKPVEQSSDEDEKEDEELKNKEKKKKLTPAERAQLARQEEERLRKIETELADPDTVPKTADQFDRLVLANPNSSLLWINYIAFHLEATEIEKARSVARKALKNIEFREEQEKLNVWIAFLNLENRYGSKESFSSILEEAVRTNDSLAVYLQSLNILAESNKVMEFLELLTKVTRRYKQDPKMWIGAAEACYKCDQKEQARNLMQRAVKSLEEKLHVNLIVQFAFMESKWGETERAEAILEKILASYPRRVDVWCSYVDMLIKASRIHVARNVLERAVSQKLPPRKIKTIFSKFVQFEKSHGDKESVKKVRQLASDYVNEALK